MIVEVINIAHHPDGGVSLDGDSKAGQLRLYEPTSGTRTYIAIQAGVGNQDNTTPVVLTLPHIYPAGNGMVLKSTISGLLTWGNDETTAGATRDDNTFGVGSGDGEVKIIFNGTTADGTISWPDGEGYLHVWDNMRMKDLGTPSTKLQFSDDGTYIWSSTDGQLDLISDGDDNATAMKLSSNSGIAFVVDANSTGETGTAHKFSFNTIALGVLAEMANIDASGNLQIDGDIRIDGNDITFGNGATMVQDQELLLHFQ